MLAQLRQLDKHSQAWTVKVGNNKSFVFNVLCNGVGTLSFAMAIFLRLIKSCRLQSSLNCLNVMVLSIHINIQV